MRGIGHTLSRLPAARAFIAGAAILAGAVASVAHAQVPGSGNGDETAMAIPRMATHGGAGVALPRPLPPSDAARIRRIFALQDKGNIPEALRESEALGETRLLGHILADRYLGRFYHTSGQELADWLSRYTDEPDAPAIHALLKARLPKGMTLPPAPPSAVRLTGAGISDPVPEDTDPQDRSIPRNPMLDRAVAERAREGNATAALRLIDTTRGLSAPYAALLRAEVAQAMFTQNRDAEALDIAASAMKRLRPDQRVGLAGYVAGLAAWRLDLPELARFHFEAAARAPLNTAALRAAAAFWAARAHLRSGDPGGYAPWMRLAAEEKRTFYGLLARRALGLPSGFAWDQETLGEADVDAIAATPQGWRAFALLQVDQPERAEDELRQLWPSAQANPTFGRSLLLVAGAAGLTDLTAQLATLIQLVDGRPRDDLRFPVPKLMPRGGFRVDPALVYALTRLESNFDPTAVSPAGARGLMQIMPMTAQYIARSSDLPSTRLHDPAFNLELGQRYVAYLADQDAIGGDLIRLLASYNSGPGNFAHWNTAVRDNGDPLLFIEAIPVTETRGFVQHVLTYTWIYAERLNLPVPSLDQLSAGAFPRFTPLPVAGTLAQITPRLH
jgi:soluble lytic murein transglycosylase